MSKFRMDAEIIYNKEIADGIYDMSVKAADIAKTATPGQFVNIYTRDKSKLLPRPISICEINADEGILRLVYRANKGNTGTKEFASYKAGEFVDIFGPLGVGFEVNYDEAILIGGGVGIPPMLELSKQIYGRKVVVLGYRNNELFLKDDFLNYSKVYVATEDGSVGTKGNVLDCIKENNIRGKIILACGPKPMLKAIKEYAMEKGIECYISLEERMACGIGACLACVCKTTDINDHSLVKNARVCKDGPVFKAEDIDL